MCADVQSVPPLHDQQIIVRVSPRVCATRYRTTIVLSITQRLRPYSVGLAVMTPGACAKVWSCVCTMLGNLTFANVSAVSQHRLIMSQGGLGSYAIPQLELDSISDGNHAQPSAAVDVVAAVACELIRPPPKRLKSIAHLLAELLRHAHPGLPPLLSALPCRPGA